MISFLTRIPLCDSFIAPKLISSAPVVPRFFPPWTLTSRPHRSLSTVEIASSNRVKPPAGFASSWFPRTGQIILDDALVLVAWAVLELFDIMVGARWVPLHIMAARGRKEGMQAAITLESISSRILSVSQLHYLPHRGFSRWPNCGIHIVPWYEDQLVRLETGWRFEAHMWHQRPPSGIKRWGGWCWWCKRWARYYWRVSLRRPANTHNPPQAKIPVYAFQSSYHELSGKCLPKYPFAGELFGDAIIGAEAFRVLPSVSASLALVQHTYQRYYEEVQNSINRSRNH